MRSILFVNAKENTYHKRGKNIANLMFYTGFSWKCSKSNVLSRKIDTIVIALYFEKHIRKKTQLLVQ